MAGLIDILVQRPVTAAALAYLLYLTGLVIYRLYLCPIAKFPGPKLAAITLWWEFYYDIVCRGQVTFKLKELHKKYGGASRPPNNLS